jgi:hypothetical protein
MCKFSILFICSLVNEVASDYVIARVAELSCIWHFSEILKPRTEVVWMAQLLGERFPRSVSPMFND